MGWTIDVKIYEWVDEYLSTKRYGVTSEKTVILILNLVKITYFITVTNYKNLQLFCDTIFCRL
jgi:hypothetical protein